MGSLRIVLKVLFKTALVLVAAFELFGCAAPAALTVAGLAADGASLAASGKSISDHALSAATGSDCSMLGVLDDGVLCRDRVPEPAVVVENAPPPLAGPPPPAPPPAAVDNSAATFLALGAFPDWANADHAVVMGRFYNPLIVPLATDAKGEPDPGGASAYWVVALRPLAGGDAKVPVAQAKSIGFKDARTLVLCRATYRPAPCADTSVADATVAGGTGAAGASGATGATGASAPASVSADAAAPRPVAQAAPAAQGTPVAGAMPIAGATPIAPTATASNPVAQETPTPLLARPVTAAQLAQRPTPPDTDMLY